MITREEYKRAIEQKDAAAKVINEYHAQEREAFKKRLEENPVFTDDELFYSATALCLCGHGLAYPKECAPDHHWDCSAILKGIADPNERHTGELPFMFYDIKGESEHRGTTRGVYRPRNQAPSPEPSSYRRG